MCHPALQTFKLLWIQTFNQSHCGFLRNAPLCRSTSTLSENRADDWWCFRIMACGWSLIVLLCDADSAWANQNQSASKSPFHSPSDGYGDMWLTDWSARGFQQSRDKTFNCPASVVSVHKWTFNNVNNVTVLTANGSLMGLFLLFVSHREMRLKCSLQR